MLGTVILIVLAVLLAVFVGVGVPILIATYMLTYHTSSTTCPKNNQPKKINNLDAAKTVRNSDDTAFTDDDFDF